MCAGVILSGFDSVDPHEACTLHPDNRVANCRCVIALSELSEGVTSPTVDLCVVGDCTRMIFTKAERGGSFTEPCDSCSMLNGRFSGVWGGLFRNIVTPAKYGAVPVDGTAVVVADS